MTSNGNDGGTMKTSDKAALIAAAIGIGLALGAAWLFPGGDWWLYAIVGFVSMGAAYKALLEQTALEKVANMNDSK